MSVPASHINHKQNTADRNLHLLFKCMLYSVEIETLINLSRYCFEPRQTPSLIKMAWNFQKRFKKIPEDIASLLGTSEQCLASRDARSTSHVARYNAKCML